MKLSLNTAEHKEKLIKFLLFALNVAVACIIWWFSAQNAEKSGSMSDGIVYAIVKATAGRGVSEKTVMSITEMLTFYFRKFAHFFIYTVFSLTMFSFIRRFAIKKNIIPFLSFFICVLYAVSDEIHQYFVPGRSCELRDVLIDSCGILTGLAIIYLIRQIKLKFKKV